MRGGCCCSITWMILSRATGASTSSTPSPTIASKAVSARGSLENFARNTFGSDGPDETRRAQFILAEVPVAAVRQHLRRREPPPQIVDDLIRAAYLAVIGGDANSRNKERGIV